jgi:hypothetical protein
MTRRNRPGVAVGGDPKRAESLRKAYFAQLAFKSVQAQRRRNGGDSDAA